MEITSSIRFNLPPNSLKSFVYRQINNMTTYIVEVGSKRNDFRVWQVATQGAIKPVYSSSHPEEVILKVLIVPRMPRPLAVVLYSQRIRVYEMGKSLRLLMTTQLQDPIHDGTSFSLHCMIW